MMPWKSTDPRDLRRNEPSPSISEAQALRILSVRADPRGTLEDIVLRVTPAKAAGFINHLWGR